MEGILVGLAIVVMAGIIYFFNHKKQHTNIGKGIYDKIKK